MDVTAIRKAMATQISSVVGAPLTCYWFVPDAVTEPSLWVQPDVITYDRTMRRGLDEMTFKLHLLVSRTDDQAAQTALDGYLKGSGPTSIKAALEAGRGAPGELALGGVCDDFRVTEANGYQYYTIGQTVYLGAVFAVFVIGSGS